MTTSVEIRALRPDERGRWLELRALHWPGTSRETLAAEAEEILADPERYGVLVAARQDGGLVGFVEVSIRDWAEGCDTRSVGYVEGWYVAPEHRRRGLGRGMIASAERWASDRGCTEMGSDAELENQVSHEAHRELGYSEVVRLVLFQKKLAP